MQPVINHLPLHIPEFHDDASGAADIAATNAKARLVEALIAVAIVIGAAAVVLGTGYLILSWIARIF
jgi:hypothetical protein